MVIIIKTMDNETIIKKITEHQLNKRYHSLTCGNDSSHQKLIAKEFNSKVILACLDCDYTQAYIPSFITK